MNMISANSNNEMINRFNETHLNFINALGNIANDLKEINADIDNKENILSINVLSDTDVKTFCKYCDDITNICTKIKNKVMLYEKMFETMKIISEQLN